MTLTRLNVPLVPGGSALTLSVTGEVYGPSAETVTANVVLELLLIVRLLGETATEKSATPSFTCLVCVRPPLLAVIVRVYVPVGVEGEVLIANVEEPEPATELWQGTKRIEKLNSTLTILDTKIGMVLTVNSLLLAGTTFLLQSIPKPEIRTPFSIAFSVETITAAILFLRISIA